MVIYSTYSPLEHGGYLSLGVHDWMIQKWMAYPWRPDSFNLQMVFQTVSDGVSLF